MKFRTVVIFSFILAILVYASISVLKKDETKEGNYKETIIFINNGEGKEGYIGMEGMEKITSLLLPGTLFARPVKIDLETGMGNEDLYTIEGAVEAIFMAKATNNKEWEYSMTEYYLMKKERDIYFSLSREARRMLDREDEKFKDYNKITMDLNVKIGNNILCLMRCYLEDGHEVKSLMLREIGGQFFQMKPRTLQEKIESLYAISSYATGVYRPVAKEEKPPKSIRSLLRI